MKCDLTDDYSVAAVGIPSVILGVVLGALGCPSTQPVSMPEPHTVVYDCINIQHAPPATTFAADHPARYAIARLQRACEQQDAALALMQVWETNPAAGEVAQP